jgi:hypothetical protein
MHIFNVSKTIFQGLKNVSLKGVRGVDYPKGARPAFTILYAERTLCNPG